MQCRHSYLCKIKSPKEGCSARVRKTRNHRMELMFTLMAFITIATIINTYLRLRAPRRGLLFLFQKRQVEPRWTLLRPRMRALRLMFSLRNKPRVQTSEVSLDPKRTGFGNPISDLIIQWSSETSLPSFGHGKERSRGSQITVTDFGDDFGDSISNAEMNSARATEYLCI